jgi:PAS domain S-box-containing protein
VRTAAPHILVVASDDANRALLERMLVGAGFTVETMARGRETLARLHERVPDLVVLDINLPDMDGRELLRHIRDNPAWTSLPAMHVSATYVDGHDIGAALDSGADAYLTLPVDTLELTATVRAVLRARHAEEAAHQLARQWQKTFDAISDGVCLLDHGGFVQRCNRAFCLLVGRSFAQVIGMPFASLTAPALGIEALPVSDLDELHAGAVVQFQSGERWFRAAADPVLDDVGRLQGAVVIITDITNEKRVEQAMQQSNAELIQANRIKDEFLATLSHELRTPLNAILGWMRLLRGGRLDEAAIARALETIDRNASLQARLVEDLLDVSRIITGKLRLKIVSVDPISVIEAAINSVRAAAEAKAITVVAELDPQAGLISADGDRLQQVMWNLLSNAIKFTPAGGHVRVQLLRTTEGMTIRVSDDGSGIPMPFLPFVFERFRQFDSSTTRAHGGLGLGLAIVRHLIELHGGTVQAESAGEGRGSTFTLVLPLIAPARETPVAVRVPSPPEAERLDGLTLLLLDDEVGEREQLATWLAQLGAGVQLVATLDEAEATLGQVQVDVAIVNVRAPDEEAFIRRLRAREGRVGCTPAIALLAGEAAAGYDLCVAKRVDVGELARMIVELARPDLTGDTERIVLGPDVEL